MRYKKITCFLVLSMIFAGFLGLKNSPIIAGTGNRVRLQPAHVNARHYTLGSDGYINGILKIASKSGYKSALYTLMADVGKYGSDIDTNDYNTNLKLYKLVSYLIYKTGYVDENVHYFRNKLNRAPKTLGDLLRINSSLSSSRRWRLLPVVDSFYHMQGRDGIYDLKFISADGFCEAVYNKYGVLLTEKNDPINMGTFNYAAGIKEPGAHEKYDVVPYLKWGNTPDSTQKGANAIDAALKNCERQYNMHSTMVAAYRKNLIYALNKA